jgi:hypothetical protein
MDKEKLKEIEEPDKPEEIVILSVTDAAGEYVALTDDEEQQLIDECWDDWRSRGAE